MWSRRDTAALVVLLVLAAGATLPGLFSRAIWYDEAGTLLEAGGHAAPVWPVEPVEARVAKRNLEGSPSLREVRDGLRRTDIHPPVYYWILSLWRRALGSSIEVARALSLVCSAGTALVLYVLLRAARIDHPFALTTTYALSTGAVLSGQDARGYAMASLLIWMAALFAYRASDLAQRDGARARVHAVAMAVCCGVAAQTNYLTLFPVAAVLGWFLWRLWPVWGIGAAVPPGIAVAIGVIGFSTLWRQTGARPHQFAGHGGLLSELATVSWMNVRLFWTPTAPHHILRPVNAGLIMLIASSIVRLVLGRRRANRSFWTLLLGLALAPSLGLVVLDLVFDKSLHAPRYLAFAGPAVAVMVAYGITGLLGSTGPGHRAWRRPVGWALLGTVWGVQLLGINWGSEQSPLAGSRMRSLARTIEASSARSHVVVIGAGSGRGHPASLLYELDPRMTIAVLSRSRDLGPLLTKVLQYEDVWISFALDRATREVEEDLLRRLEQSGQYAQLRRDAAVVHLRRVKGP